MKSAEIKEAMDQAVSLALNEIGDTYGCRPLEWHLDASWSAIIVSGFDGGIYSEDAVPSVLADWQTLLGLDEIDDPAVKGARTLTGTLDGGLTISVTGVVDQDAYDADAETFTAADA